MLTGDLWVNPNKGKILKHIRRILSFLNEVINAKILFYSECCAWITLATFAESKIMLWGVLPGKPGSGGFWEGSLSPGGNTKGCLPFLTSSFCISWKVWQKSFDSQGGCQLSVAKCWGSGEEPRVWLWSLSAVRLAASDKCGKRTKAATIWPSKSTHLELPSLYCQM